MLEEDLTTGEKLYLLRRRSGVRLRKFAAEWSLTPGQWLEAERDRATFGDTFRGLTIGGLRGPHEYYVTLRRRKGWSVKDLAQRMGLSPSRLVDMEAGRLSIARLTDFWGH